MLTIVKHLAASEREIPLRVSGDQKQDQKETEYRTYVHHVAENRNCKSKLMFLHVYWICKKATVHKKSLGDMRNP